MISQIKTPKKSELPGKRIWDPFRGADYLVFIDESGYQFFGFDNPEGNFCHAALGVPATEYSKLSVQLGNLATELRKNALAMGRPDPGEIKWTVVNALGDPYRRKFAQRLAKILAAHGCFVAGFFTSTKGTVLERVRERLIDSSVDAVPDEYDDLYEQEAAGMRAAIRGPEPGLSELIKLLLYLPIASMAFFLGSQACPFRVIYDPREEKEDEAVNRSIAEILPKAIRALDPKCSGFYGGMSTDRSSHDELGLQVADFIAGEVRSFFRHNPTFRTYGSSLQLLTGRSREKGAVYERFAGRLLKKGRVTRLPSSFSQRLIRARTGSYLPYFRNLFAAGLITCTTDLGQERDIRIFEGTVFDLCD